MSRPVTRMERVSQVNALLEHDRVLTTAQLARHNLTADGFPSLPMSVRPLVTSDRTVDVKFVARSRAWLENHPTDLPHMVGTIAIRDALDTPRDTFIVDRGGRVQRPDAVIREGGRLLAVEFDAGYPKAVVKQKLRTFERQFDDVIWGTTSPLRASRLRAVFPDIQVLTVDYWS